MGDLRHEKGGNRKMIRSMELFESTWVVMSVGISLIIGFVGFVVMMNDKNKDDKNNE